MLVTGGTGQVGSALLRRLGAAGVPTIAPDRRELDLCDPDGMRAYLDRTPFGALINCAAYTAVDRAEDEPDLAAVINARAPGIMAEEAARRGAPILHISTDYVFDGTGTGAYAEDASTNPLGVYGHTKLEGERAVRAANPHHAIIRTAWVVSADGANFLNTMLRLGRERSELAVVDDQQGCPTAADDIAEAVHAIWSQLGERGGTWHFVNAGEASWFDLARFIFSRAGRYGLHTPDVRPIATADYPTRARRPANSRLSTVRFERDFGLKPRVWQDAIAAIMTQKFGQQTESEL